MQLYLARELCEEMEKLNLGLVHDLAAAMEVEPTLESEIRKGQLEDEKLKEIRQLIKENKTSDFSEDSKGTLLLGKRVCVPNLKHLWKLILQKAHSFCIFHSLGA